MEVLKTARRPVRREFDGYIQELEILLQESPLNIDAINVKFKLFSNTWDTLNYHDNCIIEQMTTDGVTVDIENQEWDEIKEFNVRGETISQRKEKLVSSQAYQSTESIAGATHNPETRVRNFKLPDVQLKKFSGELKDWLGFWGQFQKIHEDQQMSGSDKYWYLLQSLEPKTDAYEIVVSYPSSNENYQIAIEALKKQYGNEDLLLQVYIREILSLVISNVNSKEKLPMKNLFLKLDANLRALKTLNLQNADPATWLFPLVESCLPDQLLYNWQRNPLSSQDGSKEDPAKSRLDMLMSFVEQEVEIRQRIELTRRFAHQQRGETNERKTVVKENRFEKRGNVPTLSSFHNADKRERRPCVFCEKTNHDAGDCYRAKAMSYDERISILKQKRRCFRCTGNHIGSSCAMKDLQCEHCKRRHLTLLCREEAKIEGKRQFARGNYGESGNNYQGFSNKRRFVNERPEDNGDPATKKLLLRNDAKQVQVTQTNANVECSDEVALQTLLVRVNHDGGSRVVRAFIDSGSQRSYILKATAKELALETMGVERVVHSLFGGKQTSTVAHQKYEISLSSLNHEYERRFEIRDSEKICGSLPRVTSQRPDIVKELQLKNVQLTDVDGGKKEIELLIGSDVYAKIITGRIEKLDCGVVAVHTELGWSLLGSVSNGARDDIANMCVSMSVQDTNLEKLWTLEAIGIEDPSKEESEKKRMELEIEKFMSNISRLEDGRYEVKLPWKNNLSFLPSNRAVAFKRLQSVSNKLKSEKLFAAYSSIFLEWETEGFIERVSVDCDANVVHYLPHRPIIKDSATTPVRPVFDASCRVGKSPSLNDCLFTGQNYVKPIPELIQRFREKLIAFVSDIRKAFQMIGVNPSDRDAMRFLWWIDERMEKLVEYRHVRVMFGATCSPFILGAVLYFHLTNLAEKNKEVGAKLLSALYVDNCVSSEDSVDEYKSFRHEATELLKSAGMDLRLWYSNVDEFQDPNTHTVSVLGLQWDRVKDELFVPVKKVIVPEKITKRSVLSAVQKIYDPIGFTSPALLQMKLLLQRAWIHKLKWDQELPANEKRMFMKWSDEVADLEMIRLPRLSTAGVTDRSKWSVHTFTDASKEAYSAVVFLRVETETEVQVQLLAAKSRVAPIKPLTIPKLELMGCLIGKRLTESVKKALNMHNVSEYYWSDSTTALAWISRDPDLWGTFVANRTREIREGSDIENWRHVPGAENPADLPSRGCLPSKLVQSKWWLGPTWLCKESSDWPKLIENIDENEILCEMKKSKSIQVELNSLSVLKAVQNCGFYSKKVRVVGWIRRFLHNKLVKNPEKRTQGPLSKIELTKAEIIVIREIQREHFPKEERDKLNGLIITEDEWGLLRVTTRLTYRDDPMNFKYPMLLPRKGEEVEQLIRETHRSYCHAGVGFLTTKLRQKYWILKARHTIKRVLNKCIQCKRYTCKPVIPEAAPLPLDRIKNAEVFEVVGVDLAGPLILRNGKKVWIAIFTCAVYRAVHFELVSNISTKSFVNSLEKFTEKFRRPTIIYSDNGTNFRGADNMFRKIDWSKIELEENTSQIIWRFNPVTSSWWGGWWERLIRTAKDLLKRSVGKKSLMLNELKAVLRNVAEVMNGRPLTYVTENPEDLEPLTPSLFLHPFGNTNFPERGMSEAENLRFRHNYVTTLKKELRGRFLKEYLSMLVNRNPKKVTKGLKVGELVLVGCDNLKRIEWPLGRVMELIPGKDGVIRVARVKTQRGEMTRSVQRIYPLEMDNEIEVKEIIRDELKTRSGRKVIKPVRFI